MADGDYTLSAVNTDTKPALVTKAYSLVVGGDYKTLGYAITPASVGLTSILGVIVVGGGAGYFWAWKTSTSSLLAYEQADSDNDLALEEIVDSQAISTPTLSLIIFGYKS